MNHLPCWVDVPENTDFSIYNIPFGIFSVGADAPRPASIIGDQVIDLAAVAETGLFDGLDIPASIWQADVLNPFIALGKEITNEVRLRLQASLGDEDSPLKSYSNIFRPVGIVDLHLPVYVRDYTDFYSSIEHATNLGKLFRDPDNALLPNWRHLPVGYHGRASSIVVSGQNIHRPKGQTKPADGPPVYGPTQRLDIELEMAFIIGKDTSVGQPIPIAEAEDYVFGMTLFNDWSARDIQKWEYVPLGPFLGKNFASSVSPWIVTMEALQHVRVAGPEQKPAVLPYLQIDGKHNYNIKLEVGLQPDGGKETIISKSNYKYMYWNQSQQLAHHTVNGCNVHVGDMMASGTISGRDTKSFGSMLEMNYGGKQVIKLDDGQERKFLQDGDTVTLRGYAEREGKRVGFGEVKTKILPAL